MKSRLRGRLHAGAEERDRQPGEALSMYQRKSSSRKINVHILNCGVTVVKAVRYEKKQKTEKELVMHSPILDRDNVISVDPT